MKSNPPQRECYCTCNKDPKQCPVHAIENNAPQRECCECTGITTWSKGLCLQCGLPDCHTPQQERKCTCDNRYHDMHETYCPMWVNPKTEQPNNTAQRVTMANVLRPKTEQESQCDCACEECFEHRHCGNSKCGQPDMHTDASWEEEFHRLKELDVQQGGWNMGYDGYHIDRVKLLIRKVREEAYYQGEKNEFQNRAGYLEEAYQKGHAQGYANGWAAYGSEVKPQSILEQGIIEGRRRAVEIIREQFNNGVHVVDKNGDPFVTATVIAALEAASQEI